MTVSSGGPVTGGLVGQVGSAINRSYATGSVSGTAQVGGLAGFGRNVTDSYATGNVSGTSTKVGGLVGWQGAGSISNSYATGSVGGASDVGGLVGFSDQSGASIATSYASGAVTGSGNRVGGLAGSYLGSIANSYATGSASGASNVGGLVGELDGGAGAGTIANSYATGAVSASVAGADGLLGQLLNGATVTASYWDTVTTGQATSAGGAGAVGKTTAQMKSLATFAGWDIDDEAATGAVWRIYEGNSYPLLRSFLAPLNVTANDATKTYDGIPYSGGNGVRYSWGGVPVVPNANLLGTLTYGGSAQGAVDVDTYAIWPGGFYSNQQGYDISYTDGMLTISAAPPTPPTPPTPTSSPTVPGAPPDGYFGALASVSGDGKAATAAPPLLALAQTEAMGDDEANGAASVLPSVPGFTIIPCGQALPPALTHNCR